MTSGSAGYIILTPTQPVGSGRPQQELNPGSPHQELSALPTELPHPPVRYYKRYILYVGILLDSICFLLYLLNVLRAVHAC